MSTRILLELLTSRRTRTQTTLSHLILVTVDANTEETAYRTPSLSAPAQRHFLPGAGEGLPLPSMSLFLEGVIRIEGNLIRHVIIRVHRKDS